VGQHQGRASKDGRTWTSLIYMMLHLVLGTIYFTIAVVSGRGCRWGVLSSAVYELATGKNAVQVHGYPELDRVSSTRCRASRCWSSPAFSASS